MAYDIESMARLIATLSVDEIEEKISIIYENIDSYQTSKEKHERMKGKAQGLEEALKIFTSSK